MQRRPPMAGGKRPEFDKKTFARLAKMVFVPYKAQLILVAILVIVSAIMEKMYFSRGCFASGYSRSAVQIRRMYSTVNTATAAASKISNHLW